MSDRLVVTGVFEAERFLRSPDMASLPSLPDKESEKMLVCMDEILFPLASSGDAVIIRRGMDKIFMDYLYDLGFHFICNTEPLEDVSGADGNMYKILSENTKRDRLLDSICKSGQGAVHRYFAAIPHIDSFSAMLGMRYKGPDPQICHVVNSKTYSTSMRKELDMDDYGCIVTETEALKQTCLQFLIEGSCLVKEPFGVSGKGSILIRNEKTLSHIVHHMENQIKKGKRIELIVEPLLPVAVDFSSQLAISSHGEVSITSLHRMHNVGFAYGGIASPDDDLEHLVEQSGYLDQMLFVGKHLYADGYHGPVCVDSMVLDTGLIVPIVEINARMSMSHIKCGLDKHFDADPKKSLLTHYNVVCHKPVEFMMLLQQLREDNLLLQNQYGFMPLSPHCMTYGKREDKSYKGRLYGYILGKDEKSINSYAEQVKDALQALGITILGNY